MGVSNNQFYITGLATTNGSPGLFSGGLQYEGNQGNILPHTREVNGLANNGDFATYTSSGIAPFSNYLMLNVSTFGTLSANANGRGHRQDQCHGLRGVHFDRARPA